MTTSNCFNKNFCIAAILFITSSLTGCATLTRQEPTIYWVAPGEHHVVSNAAEFRDMTPVRIQFKDIWQIEEYTLYKAADSQLEIIFTKVNRAHNVSIEYQKSIEDMVSSWNYNAKKNLEWRQPGRLDIQPGTWFYRTYTHSDSRRSCVGFFVEWYEIFEDPQTRPGSLLIGYYCVDGTEGLDDQKVRKLIGGIGIQPQDESFAPTKAAPEKSENASAIAAARGDGPNSDTGNSGFPFMFARPFTESGSGKYN